MKKPEAQVAEIRSAITGRGKDLQSLSLGQRTMHEWALKAAGQSESGSPFWWAHLAHMGTLLKLDGVLARDGPYETFELLAIARNLFENLIWVRLIASHADYGFVFHVRFLIDQVDNLNAQIVKLEAEAELFASMDEVEDDNIKSAFSPVLHGLPSCEESEQARLDMNERTATLDDLVRREFCLFAAPARSNGYGFQAHLLRKTWIPDLQKQLADVQQERSALEVALAGHLPTRLLNIATNKWNWRNRAEDVHLGKHYAFLYGYTSRLLHSTPLNIVTEKALTESEAYIILDYIALAVDELLDRIESFKYPGQRQAVFLDLNGTAPDSL